jgi:polysaccharide export outer membrane protein
MSRTNWSIFFTTRGWLCLAAIALGGIVALQTPTASAAEAREYPVGPGDQLHIAVFGDENVSALLSGRFRVEPTGSIYYPLLGKLDVAGLSPVEVADLIGDLLSTQVRVNHPTVSVAEFAPVFLVGDVITTGPFEFQPDMTVFQLVMQAGGISREAASESARLSLQQELSSLELNNFSLRVQKARIMAELEGGEFDEAAFSDATGVDAENIVSAEASIFAVHRKARESRRRTSDAQREGYDQEISSVEKSIVLHDEEVRLLEEQVGVQEGLATRGLAANSTLRDAQRLLTATRREALEFRTALYRAKQDRIGVDQALAEAETRTDEENVESLRDIELELYQNEIALASAKARYAQFGTVVSAAQNALGRVPQFRLVRLVDGEYTARIVDELTKLERGDIVRVVFAETAPPTATVEQAQSAQPSR